VDYPASISGYERESLAAEANLAAEFGLPEYGIDRCRKQAWVLKKGLVESRVGGSEYRSEEEFLRGLED
jgi:hypothetical protein